MCMLVARCGWLANSAALCLISQSFAIFHRHSWCLKKIENKISFKFHFFVFSVKAITGDCTIFRLESLLGASCPLFSVYLSSFFRISLLFYISLGSLVPIASHVSLVSTLSLVLSLSLYFSFIFCHSSFIKIMKLSNNCRTS